MSGIFNKVLRGGMCILLAAIIMASPVFAANVPLKDAYDVKEGKLDEVAGEIDLATKYKAVSAGFAGTPYAASDIPLLAVDAVRADGKPVPLEHDKLGATAINWNDRTEMYEWTVEIPADALYEVMLTYMPSASETTAVQRSIVIDGEEPYFEAANFILPRLFVEIEEPVFNSDGDEQAPRMEQPEQWRSAYVTDPYGHIPGRLRIRLTAGVHTVGIRMSTCDILLASMALTVPETVVSYAEYSDKNGNEQYSGEIIRFEAEAADYRSTAMLRRGVKGNPEAYPHSPGYERRNVIGSWYWRKPRETVTWKFNVPQDGNYKLSLNYYQDYKSGLSVYRRILIDGDVPFSEMEAYDFKYTGKKFKIDSINQPDGTPYLFYLEEGPHELTFEIVTGEYGGVVDDINALNVKLTNHYREITAITGVLPDMNYNYELDKKIPKTIEGLYGDLAELRAIGDKLEKITGKTPTSSLFFSYASELEGMLRNIEGLPRMLKSLTNIQQNIASTAGELQSLPLVLDYIAFQNPQERLPGKTGGFVESIIAFFAEFFRSFFKDYDATNVGVSTERNSIDVWVANSREYGDLIQRLCNEEFERDHGIKVNVNILPAGSVSSSGLSPLMLTVISRDQPDVVIGADASTPVDLAIREALVDLSQFDGFDDVAARFFPTALDGFKYGGGIYAVPLTMDIPVMFYRKDIMGELGLNIPETWTELASRVLPSLKQSNYDFFLSSGMSGAGTNDNTAFMNYTMFLYQNGGRFYTEDGLDTALDSDVAYSAFKTWTDLYVMFNMDEQAELFNHFRRGDIPLAVGGLYNYAQIAFAAPELYGRWGIAPIPGVLKSDGTIDRTAAGGVNSCVMFDNGEERKQMGWKFLEWWTSAEIQSRYASEIEGMVGEESRWFSANVEAFKKLPWPQEHLDIMMDWSEYFIVQPNVLGTYIVPRTINNAWTTTVISRGNPRDAFENGIKEIRLEMKRKQLEYEIGGDVE